MVGSRLVGESTLLGAEVDITTDLGQCGVGAVACGSIERDQFVLGHDQRVAVDQRVVGGEQQRERRFAADGGEHVGGPLHRGGRAVEGARDLFEERTGLGVPPDSAHLESDGARRRAQPVQAVGLDDDVAAQYLVAIDPLRQRGTDSGNRERFVEVDRQSEP